MRTFLLAWNPKKWSEEEFSAYVKEFQRFGRASGAWSVGQRRDLPVGSRLYLVRVGREPKGLVASGFATSAPSEGPHWDQAEAELGKTRWGVEVEFDHVQTNPVLSIDDLQCPPFDNATWLIQGSGVELSPIVAAALEARWAVATRMATGHLAEELTNPAHCSEGAKTQITINSYERNQAARSLCIRHHGTNCSVCGMSFGKTYGAVFEGFIHVHHLRPISKAGVAHRVDPQTDLCPVCPNCHSVMHLKNPPYTVSQVKQLLAEATRRGTPELPATKSKA